ncbi:hypothetical protein MDOR_15310 [Mycolicibacterium doricum]|uniref:Uncharacterized protein n=1 Tax=Mycolicibacterium doricum TaxID=126673 RepID=A0A7I7VRR4_9MYCO|nr:hypothetical protein MDOR_15310 [Mycolicibacterium doricum]
MRTHPHSTAHTSTTAPGAPIPWTCTPFIAVIVSPRDHREGKARGATVHVLWTWVSANKPRPTTRSVVGGTAGSGKTAG